MRLSKKERRFWKTKFSFKDIKSIPEEMEHLNLRDEDFGNEELCFITSRIRIIDRLDLDSNPLDDEGMECLTRLESIKELRLKSVDITDEAVKYIKQLQSLELLHLGSTGVSCEGVKNLSGLKNLKTLLVSPKEIEEEKLNYFLQQRPDCKLIVNYQEYSG
ncbi:hypothetical protein [Salinimicrobium soli]|uniref:hypothetical protein n=1 Tax=Salinimicrobium soli TaxID=1254399 RepID=UPI003AAFC089